MTGKILFSNEELLLWGLFEFIWGPKKLIFKKIRHFEFRHLEKLEKVGMVKSGMTERQKDKCTKLYY